MKNSLLIYGAYGYTGELIAYEAVRRGMKPILAGRDEAKLKPLAEKLGLPYAAFSVDDTAQFTKELTNVAVILHCAGPFQYTYKAVADVCLATGTHYLDITGEYEVFEALAARNAEAQKAGVMLMPGTGFDVVPSDCLALHLKNRLPAAQELTLAFYGSGRPSRGTAKTVIESMGKGGAIRKDGKIVPVPAGWKSMEMDFGDGVMRWAATIPWGDIATAWQSTGIPNIMVYMAMHGKQAKKLKYLNMFGWLVNNNFVKNYLKAQVDKQKPGPSERARTEGYSLLWGQVKDAAGNKAQSTIKVQEGYTLTAATSVEIAARVLAGNFTVGFQTPAKQYGEGLITEFGGSVFKDF